MNPIELSIKETGAQFGWRCGQCGTAWGNIEFDGAVNAAKDIATECCVAKVCDCGKPFERYYLVCADCRAQARAAKELEVFEKAKKVSLAEYEGTYLYIEAFGDTGAGDGYFLSHEYDDAIEHAEEMGVVRPAFAWATSPTPASFDLRAAVESYMGDNLNEDAFEQVDTALLDKAQELIDAAIKPVVSYEPDYSVAVLIPSRET